MKLLQDSTIIVCSIVRNAGKGLKKNIPIIDALCDKAKDYKIVIYENDSTDNTKKILKKWSNHRGADKIHLLLNDNVMNGKTIPSYGSVTCNPFFSKKRIERMVYCRNQYLSYLRKKNWNADYIIVVDLDVKALYLNGILSSFNSDFEWDAITAYGYSRSPSLQRRYHDTYALIELGKETESQTELKIKQLSYNTKLLSNNIQSAR
ncbi:MAG: glycosyltransferase family 2 protein [Prevotellaceae bacterium]|nr:glycosyltransferase family 2 protein [Prevotellaceae bacterium]